MSSEPPPNLFPRPLVEAIRAEPRSTFVPAYGSAPLLLVRLDDPEGELGARLHETCTASIDLLHPNIEESDSTSNGTSTAIGDVNRPRSYQRARFDPAKLRSKIAQGPIFVVALRKRAGMRNPFSSKICVGRSSDSDIVLCHPSVSKFHGWFEVRDGGRVYLGNAGSKNATCINDQIVARHDLPEVLVGDEIAFGNVRTLLCNAELLWDALDR
jgi:hypothetical protein